MSVVAIIYMAYKCLHRVWGRVSVRQCGGGGCNWSRVSAGRPGRETTAASHDHRYRTRGYLAWSPDLERWTVVWCCFHLRIIAPIVVCFSPSCLPMVL